MTTTGPERALDRAYRLPPLAVAVALAVVVGAAVLSAVVGPLDLGVRPVVVEVLGRIPGLPLTSGLTDQQAVALWQWRLPRIVLGGLVGSALALSGATYQGVFRNPLADPYLLGVAAGAGLGATVAIVGGLSGGWGPFDAVAVGAFAGALVAVSVAALVARGAGATPAALLLAGIAVAAFFTAVQTDVQLRDADTLRQVYTWILGRVSTAGWGDVAILGPYLVVCGTVILLLRRQLDVLRLGDEEAAALGVRPGVVRVVLVVAASLLAAAAVSVSGLISFVGIIVPHLVRLTVGTSYRVVLPLSAIGGAALLVVADLAARTVASPAELPIGVITAFLGAPFFILILVTNRGVR
ncbi:MAG: FecCD family ABC transporter permease [Acidimicrobiales bacterium]